MEYIQDFLAQIDKWPFALVLVFALNVLAWMLKKIEVFPDKFIGPSVVSLAAVLYPFVGEIQSLKPDTQHRIIVMAIYGIVIGFIAWAGHGLFWGVISKFPGFKNGNDDAAKPPGPPS